MRLTTDTTEILTELDELRDLRRDAQALARSGHPGVRAEGERALELIQQDIRDLMELLRAQL